MLGCLFLLLQLTVGIFSRPWIHCLFLLAFVRTFSKTSIPSLIHIGSPVTSSSFKADVLNQYFSCFNRSSVLLPPLAHNLYPSLHDNSPDSSVTKMKFAISFLIFLLTLLLVLTVSPLSCFTTQLLVFHFLPIFSNLLSQQVFSLQTGKLSISYLLPNQKPLLHPLQTNAQSLYIPFQVRSWKFTS